MRFKRVIAAVTMTGALALLSGGIAEAGVGNSIGKNPIGKSCSIYHDQYGRAYTICR